ncbi:MAG: arsinothricin resistance N-acetyltransferase ArsN1 family A [Bacillota bacterium]
MVIRHATASDAAAIARIYNQAIEERIATFETEPRTPEERRRWLESHGPRHPVLVAQVAGQVAGWASIGPYRPRSCYDGVGEFSIYVDAAWRGRGVGRRLLTALIETAERLGYWKLVSRVFDFNVASRALCRSCGFREVGTYEKHGRLDGRWIDCVIVERLIPENIR